MQDRLTRRDFIGAAGAALAMGACATDTPGASTKPQPNIVFVFPDEFRRQAVGCMGEDPVLTPHLDQFAAQGVVFTNAISNRPLCSPYRASLLTGRYPFSNGVTTNCWTGNASRNQGLRESERCISDVLRDQGYACGYIGKWHLEMPQEPYLYPHRPGDVWDEYTPPGPRRHGFEFWHSYGCHDNHFKPHYWTNEAARDQYREVAEWSPRHETSVAIDYIRNTNGERPAGRPFALFVSMNPPHMPFELVPQEYVERYGARTCQELLTRPNVKLDTELGQVAKKWAKHYFAAVTGVDEQFGRIMQCLKDEGLEDDTIVVFTSDHGEMMGSQGRMYKSVWYEESLGVPFIVRWPGRVRPGREDLLLSVPDVMPTLLGLAGLHKHIPAQVEGADYADALLGRRCERPSSALYLDCDAADRRFGARGVRTNTHMYAVNRRAKGEQRYLFDMQHDPYQMRNLIGQNTAIERDLQAQLDTWLDNTRDPWRAA